MENAEEMLSALMQAAEAFEGYSLHQFRMYRERRVGGTQTLEVTVKVSDGSNPKTRYSVSFETEDGGRVSGNAMDTLYGACYILRSSPHID